MKMSSITKKWIIETDNYKCIIRCYDEAHKKYAERIVTQRYAVAHINYLQNNAPERITNLLNSGNIYKYLMTIQHKAEEVLDDQLDRLKQNDKEYTAALIQGDIIKAVGLENGLAAQVNEIIYQNIINN